MPDYDTKNPILDPVEPPAEGVTPPVGTFERPDVGAGAKRLEEEPRGTAAVAELLSAVRDLREDFSRVFGASKEVVTERVKGLRDRAGRPPSRMRERAAGVYERDKEWVGSAVEGAGRYVREQPMTSLLVAAGAGCCLGLLLSRGLRTDDDDEH